MIGVISVMKLASDVMVPIFAAILVGSILAQIAERLTVFGLPQGVANTLVVTCAIAIGLGLLGGLIEPFTSLVARAPDMARTVQDMSGPLLQRWSHFTSQFGNASAGAASLPGLGDATSWISAFLGRLTPRWSRCWCSSPASRSSWRGATPSARKWCWPEPSERASRLSTLRVIVAVEKALSLYFLTTAIVYASVRRHRGVIAASFGLANPLLWAAMTFAAAYIPYIGVALITLALAAAGVLTYHQSLLALAPAGLYLCVHLFSETAVMPTLLGRRRRDQPVPDLSVDRVLELDVGAGRRDPGGAAAADG